MLLLNYEQFLNLLGDENFAAKIKFLAPFEFDLINNIIEIYDKCVKGPGIMIKDPILTKQVAHIMGSLIKLVKQGGSHKWYVQILHGNGMESMLRGVIAHFVGDPTLIFRALVTYEK